MIRLDDIDRALGAREPTVADPGSAVAAILCNAESPQLLFIERARVEGDPWSGDIAFPGGRVEPQDDGLQAAAERETQEEIGLDLGHGRYIGRLDDLVAAADETTASALAAPTGMYLGFDYHPTPPQVRSDLFRLFRRASHPTLGHGRYIGRLDDLVTQSLGIQVAACVYAIDDDDDFQLSHEVAAAFWRPLSHLADPARQFSHTFASRGFPRNLPAIDLLGPGKPPLWGITYRFVAQLMRLAGHPLPES